MRITVAVVMAVSVFVTVALWGADAAGKTETVKGYVIDSACAFTKGLEKPISPDCARACAKAGSPLAILTADGTIYWPIAGTTPSSGQNDKLLPFAASDSKRKNFRAQRIEGDRDRQDRSRKVDQRR